MDFTNIIIAAVSVGGIGLVTGLLLGFASKKFKVEANETEELVRMCLPGNNCGGCGYAGCDGLAEAIAKGEAEVNACPVCSKEAIDKIADIMGKETKSNNRKVAFVKCAGTCEKATNNFHYYGIEDCRQAAVIPGNGEKTCAYGCMGYGSCVEACNFDAIDVKDGIAVVDKLKCVACGKCVSACPNNLIELVPYDAEYKVQCNSHKKGKAVRDACGAGCIACMMCAKVCEAGAITVENDLAHIDYDKCTGCGKCAEKCPVKIIR